MITFLWLTKGGAGNCSEVCLGWNWPHWYVSHLGPEAQVLSKDAHECKCEKMKEVPGGQGGQVAYVCPAQHQVQHVHCGAEVQALLRALNYLPDTNATMTERHE